MEQVLLLQLRGPYRRVRQPGQHGDGGGARLSACPLPLGRGHRARHRGDQPVRRGEPRGAGHHVRGGAGGSLQRQLHRAPGLGAEGDVARP